MLRKILLPLVLLQLAAVLYAKEEIWINFGDLPPGYVPEDGSYSRQYDPAPIQQGDATVVDYSNVYDPFSRSPQNLLPSRFANQTAKSGNSAYSEMRQSLAIDRWQVKLSGSSDFPENRMSTQVVAYKTKETSSRFPNEQLMAVHFDLPTLLVNSKAWIVPEFSIPAFSVDPNVDLQEDLKKGALERMGQFLGKGALRNVGAIRSITATVYGRKFPMTLTIEAEHSFIDGKQEYPMGSLAFSGWQDMVWTNPNYIIDVRKRDQDERPDYPHGIPSLVLRALRLDRPIGAVNEDSSQVVFYIKEIKVVYDEALSETFDNEIDDEQIWQLNTIKSQRSSYAQALESRKDTVNRFVGLQQRHPAFPAQDGTTAAATTTAAQPAN